MSRWVTAIMVPVGSVVGAASLISLITNYGDFSLASVASDALATYRAVMTVLRDALFSWWTPIEFFGRQFTVPLIAMDALALWVTASIARYRGDLYERMSLMGGASDQPWYHRRAAALSTLRWLILAPVGWVIFIFGQIISIKQSNQEIRDNAEKLRYHFMGTDMFDVRVRWNRHKNNHRMASILVALLVPIFVVAFFLWNAIQIRG